LIQSKFYFGNNKTDFVVILIKFFLISFIAVYLIGNFNPFFETSDAYSYGLASKQFSQGNLFYTNELIGSGVEFLPPDMMLTNDGTNLLYAGYAGFFSLTTLSYVIGGNYGLFYLGPVAGILLLITAERFSTHFFGKYVGLLTLLFLSTNHMFYRSALNLQTESLFGIFFLIGSYFLIKFFKEKNLNQIFFASLFFVLSTLIRTNGITYFPVELFLLSGFFILHLKKPKMLLQSNFFDQNLSPKKIFKILFLVTIPWIIFFIFWFSFYDYFFDNPFSNNVFEEKGTGETGGLISSILSLEEKNFENLKQYSKYFLPYQFPRIIDTSNSFSEINSILGSNWLGFVSITLLFIFVIFSFVMKKNRLIIISFSALIFSTGWFFGSLASEERALRGLPGRYMLPVFILYSMILGLFITNFYHYLNFKLIKTKFIKILKPTFVIFLLIFFIFSFYFTPPIVAIMNNDFELKNPIQINSKYPLDKEGLKKNDILIGYNFEAMDYGLIQFQPEISLKEGKIHSESFELLKKIMNNGYDVYLLREPIDRLDRFAYDLIYENSDFVVVDYSQSFCKLEITLNEKISSNRLC